MMKKMLCLSGAVLSVCCLDVRAQEIPPSADPSRQFMQGKQSAVPPVALKNKSRTISEYKVAVPKNVGKVPFLLKNVDVRGNHSFSEDELNELFQPYLGTKVNRAIIGKIARTIQKKYFDTGYSFAKVRVPEQDDTDGTLLIYVREVMIDDVEVDADLRDHAVIQHLITLIAGKALNTIELERHMLLVNDWLGGNLVSVISASQKASTADTKYIHLLLTKRDKDHKNIRGFIGIDNYGSNFVGPFVVQSGVSVGTGDWGLISLDAAAATSLQEMSRLGFDYNVPVYGFDDISVGMAGNYTQTQPGDSLAELNIEGEFFQLDASLSYEVIRQRDKQWSITPMLSFKSSHTDIAEESLFDDQLRIFSLISEYRSVDTYDGINNVVFRWERGLNTFGARKTGSINLSRQSGVSDFDKFVFTLSRTQLLPHQFELVGRFNAQYTNDPLLSSEEFGFGGGMFGRGYDPSELVGDKGYAASVELVQNYQLDEEDGLVQPFGFADFGRVWNLDSNAQFAESALSAGVGVRYHHPDEWSLNATIAVPITRDADNPPSYASAESPRYLMQLIRRF